MAVQPVPEALLPEAGAGRAIPAAPEKLQESLKGPANTALQSRKPWETKSPSDRNPMKRDAPTNSCSEPFFLVCRTSRGNSQTGHGNISLLLKVVILLGMLGTRNTRKKEHNK